MSKIQASVVINGEHSFASPISRSISHLEFFWVSGLSHLPFQMHKRYIGRIRTRDPMISRRTLSPLDYRTVAAEATENLWYLCTVAGPDPDPNPREGVNYLTLRAQFYANECNEGREANP